MWRRLSKILDGIGRIRPHVGPPRVPMFVGNARAPDALGSMDWTRFVDPESLFDVWGPPPGSPWAPYHCVPLFAALQTLTRGTFGPTEDATARQHFENSPVLEAAVQARPFGHKWAAEGAWVILDLHGPASVALAVGFVAAGFQPVCTFDHWPHPRALLKPEFILSQLLRHAGSIARLRPALRFDAPPLWICDSARFGVRRGRPNEFDNRYFLDDSILPSKQALAEAGVGHIICLVPSATVRPTQDLCAYFRDLRAEGFTNIHGAALDDPDLTPFNFHPDVFQIRFDRYGYVRSNAGGFGRLIPEPSSSSG
jgi:hypothetical protein